MIIEKNRVVSLDYKLVDDDGELIDSSDAGEPLVYLHGRGNIIAGLEKHLEGKKAGDAVKVVIAPADGYGERDEELLFTVGKDEFDGSEIAVGMQFEAHGEDGAQIVTIVGIEGDEVKVDANHPLAGENLHFDVKVVEVREASGEEVEHGHIHGAHGCDGECGEGGCGDGCECGEGGCGDDCDCGKH
jgi:FKBP-type peptidyl-prolyl cis-trans isomerase SlyD